jgi:hypothetical protein
MELRLTLIGVRFAGLTVFVGQIAVRQIDGGQGSCVGGALLPSPYAEGVLRILDRIIDAEGFVKLWRQSVSGTLRARATAVRTGGIRRSRLAADEGR